MRYVERVAIRSAVRTAATALALVMAAAACDDGAQTPLTPGGSDGGAESDVRAAQQMARPGNAPFYYYQGEKVYLETVPGQFVVKAKAGVDLPAAAREALADRGLAVRPGRALANGHQVIEVPGATRGEAKGLAERLYNHPGLGFASPTYETQAGGDDVLLMNTVMVMFEEGTSRSDIEQLNDRFGTTIQREPALEKGWRYHVLRLPEAGGKSALEIAAAYSESPLVKWADPNKTTNHRVFGGTAEPFFGEQWYLDDNPETGPNGVPADINTRDAWDNTEGVATVEVGVFDTGVDGDHEDLDNVLAGKDFFSGSPTDPAVSDSPDPGGDGHGTAVTGIIAANHNGVGVAGVAPNVTIRSNRIFKNGAFAGDQNAADAINASWKEFETDVLNNSWGGGAPSNAIAEAIEWATKDGRGGKGSVVVFSAGNDAADVSFPAEVPEAIAVSAINRSGNLSSFSNTGPEIEIAAFGGSVVSSGACSGDMPTLDPMGSGGCDDGPSGTIDYRSSFNGTSAAAPQVSAAAALLISNNSTLTEADVRQQLKSAADPWGDSDKFGSGKLNVGNLFYDGGGGGGGGGCDGGDDGGNQILPTC